MYDWVTPLNDACEQIEKVREARNYANTKDMALALIEAIESLTAMLKEVAVELNPERQKP